MISVNDPTYPDHVIGFPTVKWIDIAMFAIGLPSKVDQNALCSPA